LHKNAEHRRNLWLPRDACARSSGSAALDGVAAGLASDTVYLCAADAQGNLVSFIQSLFTGFGSDVRFVDLIRFDNNSSVDVLRPILGDQTLEFVDDSGTFFTISVEGAPPDVEVGTVRSLRIDGSLGVAVGQITVDLSGARILRIEARSQSGGGGNQRQPGVIGIGRIVLTGSDAGSQIQITGNAEIDVWQIQGAGAVDLIENRTINGDIVAIDVGGLNRLDILGDLGRTYLAGRPRFNRTQATLALGDVEARDSKVVERLLLIHLQEGVDHLLVPAGLQSRLRGEFRHRPAGTGQAGPVCQQADLFRAELPGKPKPKQHFR
jgi:hypothetical protein